jgi:hypothetical protein
LINTQNKRRSTLCVLPVPDGGIDYSDRASSTWNYSGLVLPFVNIPQWFDGATASSSWLAATAGAGTWTAAGSLDNIWREGTEVRE